jgi:tripartite-type tricarboxylate transporter receptor subunit TctC
LALLALPTVAARAQGNTSQTVRLVLHADSRIKTLQDLVQAARANPGRISYASNGSGSPLHLGASMVEASTNTRMIHVPFKETGVLYASVASGEVDWALATLGSVGPLVQANKLRLLAVADDTRSPLRPDVPTLREAGGPDDLRVTTWTALLAPRGTPRAVVEETQRRVAAALSRPEVVAKLAAMGFSATPSTSAELETLIAREIDRYASLVRRIGITAH